jgi:hypothetical protein
MNDLKGASSTRPLTRTTRVAAFGHWLRDSGLGITGFALVLTVACAGWTVSFIGLQDFGVHRMELTERAAWLVPVTFDGAALGLSLVVFRASIHGRAASVWRVLIVVFTGLSSWINWQHIDDPAGRWIASFMPPAAVILFEGLMSEARAAAARRDGNERPRLHPLRWFIDWSGTWEIYRAYVLGIELPEHLQLAANKPPTGGQDGGQLLGQDIGQDGAPEPPTVHAPTRQEPTATGRQKPPRRPAKSAAKKRRSMDEWVEIGTSVFHAEFARLRRNPSGTEFAAALAAAGYDKPSASTAKNIKTEILDRTELPSLEDQ